jgi:hypothetical protein
MNTSFNRHCHWEALRHRTIKSTGRMEGVVSVVRDYPAIILCRDAEAGIAKNCVSVVKQQGKMDESEQI